MLSHAKATYLYCSLRRSLSNAVADRDCLLRLQARGDGVEVKERTHWFVSLCVHRMTSIMGTVIVVGIIAKWRHAGLAAALTLAQDAADVYGITALEMAMGRGRLTDEGLFAMLAQE